MFCSFCEKERCSQSLNVGEYLAGKMQLVGDHVPLGELGVPSQATVHMCTQDWAPGLGRWRTSAHRLLERAFVLTHDEQCLTACHGDDLAVRIDIRGCVLTVSR